MATFNNMKELEKFINKQIQESLQKDVAPKIVKIAQEHVETDVYDVYPHPKEYQRTGQLKKSFEINPISDGVEIENTREDHDRYIPEIIEYGHDKSEQGYQYAYQYEGDNYLQPRPFIENTRQEILNTNIHVDELKDSLKRKGLDVE